MTGSSRCLTSQPVFVAVGDEWASLLDDDEHEVWVAD